MSEFKFTGRKFELERLAGLYQKIGPGLLVVKGRRSIGNRICKQVR